jgi:hypothetical protein
MPVKKAIGEASDERKKAKAGFERGAADSSKHLVRNSAAGPRLQNEIIGKDEWQLKVAAKTGGAVGEFSVDGVVYCVRRVSDYDTVVFDESTGKRKGRRPRPANDFVKFEDIANELKGKSVKWEDKDAPQLRNDFRDEDLVKEPFEYRRPEVVWPETAEKVCPE